MEPMLSYYFHSNYQKNVYQFFFNQTRKTIKRHSECIKSLIKMTSCSFPFPLMHKHVLLCIYYCQNIWRAALDMTIILNVDHVVSKQFGDTIKKPYSCLRLSLEDSILFQLHKLTIYQNLLLLKHRRKHTSVGNIFVIG